MHPYLGREADEGAENKPVSSYQTATSRLCCVQDGAMSMFTVGIFGVFSLRGQSLSFEEPEFTVIVGFSKVGKKRTQITHSEARYET